MTITEEMIAEGIKMSIEEQQKLILEWLQNVYTGARAYEDIDTMTRIARAIEAFELPTSKDVVIACKEQPNIVQCKDCFYADDFDCPAPLPTGYLCQKEHGCHTGDWFCAAGRREGESK